MEKILTLILDKIEKIDDRLNSVDKTMIKQESNLAEHMRRTDLLEIQQKSMFSHLGSEIDPIKSHVEKVKAILKFLMFIIPVVVAAFGIVYNIT